MNLEFVEAICFHLLLTQNDTCKPLFSLLQKVVSLQVWLLMKYLRRGKTIL